MKSKMNICDYYTNKNPKTDDLSPHNPKMQFYHLKPCNSYRWILNHARKPKTKNLILILYQTKAKLKLPTHMALSH